MVAQSITLQTSDSGIVASEVLGRISFAASNESSGSDAILIGASVYARADAEFTATENPTSIVLATSSTGTVTDRIIVDNSGNLKPATDIAYNLGSDTLRFSNLYAFNSNTDVIGAVKIPCKNSTGSTISAGIPVYISGHFANGKVYIDLARADTASKMPAIGILASGLGNESEGDVYIFGTVTGLNTNGFTAGTTIYVAPTGGLTSTKPTGVGELIQNMGRVARADLTNGRIILLGPGRSNDIPNSGNFQQLTVQGNPVSTGVSGGGGSVTIENSGDNRVLTSTGSTSGINAEGNFTFNGSYVNVNGSGNFASGLVIANQTATTIASFDANKNIISLTTATYPTLTELSYVKGVTSAIQTQLNTKTSMTAATSGDNRVLTSDGSVTGIVGEGNLTFNGSVLNVTGSGLVASGLSVSGSLTVSNTGVFSSGVTINSQTASTIASFDANKNIISLATATYPSLTELSYVKGVTSAIQTQLGNKAETSTTITAGSGLAGGGSLAANRTIDIGQGDGITVSADSIAVDTTVVRTTGTQTVPGAKTFQSSTTFLSGVTISNQTASTIASFDASKNVSSLSTATYPTLTELSYVKGVTSAIQTQIDSKAATATTITAGSGLVGGGSLAANRTLDIGQGDGMSITADAIAVDSTVVRTTGTQTITGDKTFGNLTATSGIITNYVGTIDTPAGGRLTLTTGSPFPSGDVSSATNIYYSPYVSNKIALYDSTNTRWQLHTFSEVTLALGTLISGRNYDVFLYDNAGTKTMEAVAWTSDSARTTAIVQQDGVYVKSGTPARRYVGTFRTTSTTTTEDSVTKRFLWNMYNRETEILFTNPGYNNNAATTSYTLTGTSVTALNGGTGSKTEMVCGLRTVVHMSVKFAAALSASAGVVVGIAIDQTTNPNGPTVGAAASADPRGVSAVKTALLEAGYHAFNLVGKNNLSATSTIYADLASSFSGTTDMVGTSMEQIYLG